MKQRKFVSSKPFSLVYVNFFKKKVLKKVLQLENDSTELRAVELLSLSTAATV